MRRGTLIAMVLTGFLVHEKDAGRINADVRSKVSGSGIPEDPPVPIPEVKDEGNSIPGYRTSDPYEPCRYQAKLGPGGCCELEPQWTRYLYNPTLDECKELRGSKCCYEEQRWDGFATLEDCNNRCLGVGLSGLGWDK